MMTASPALRATSFINHTIYRYIPRHSGSRVIMSAQTSGTATPAEVDTERRKLKVLMLHGYTQSGPLFHNKTRALEKTLHKLFPPAPITSPFSKPKAKAKASPSTSLPEFPGGIELIYPTAPIHLHPADIPGFQASELEGADPKEESDAWGWWKRETGTGLYSGLEEGLRTIAGTIREHGGIDGVIGFSQGAAAAAFVASLLEPGRREAFNAVRGKDGSAFAFPEGWEDIKEMHPDGLRFCVSYAGFYAPHSVYEAFYNPKISTPTLHFIGSLDTVVEEHRSMGLVERCDEGTRKLVIHPGGHFVPINKEMTGWLAGFMRDCLVEKQKEESVEDMDMPF